MVLYTDENGDTSAAVVTRVNDDLTTVNLTLFPDGHAPKCVINVPFSEQQQAFGTWTWPPRV
jgi:hypothetical protein